MKKKSFYIFRHALATKSLIGYGDKIITAEILPEGIPPIQKMGAYLKKIKTDYNVSSEFLRCQQTAVIIAKITGKKFKLDKRLNEYNQEEFKHFAKRVNDFYDGMQQSNHRSILLCTHAAVIAVLIQLMKGTAFDETLFRTSNPRTGVLTIVEGGEIKEIDFND